MRAQGGDAQELFDLEPRRAHWAQPIEAQISSYVLESLAELESDAQIEVECRTAICQVNADLSGLETEEAELIELYLTTAAPIGSFAQSGWGEPGHLQIYSMLPPELRTQESLATFIADFAAGKGAAESKADILEELTTYRDKQQ